MKELPKKNNLDHVFYFGKNDRYVSWSDCKSIEKPYWTAVLENIAYPEVIVTENPKYLLKYGDNIIVILKSDEFASDIEYAARVRAVFRNYFDKKYSRQKNVFFLPLPYLGQNMDIPNVQILNRRIDIFFAGQVIYPTRTELSEVILDLKRQRKDLKILFRKTQGFFSGWDISQYFNKLSNSKICLCPRGASAETYRHFESLRHGCVAISAPLPNVWYLQDAPIQIISQWNELLALVDRLVKNRDLLKEISNRGIGYWNSKLSPEAVSNFINNSIDSIS